MMLNNALTPNETKILNIIYDLGEADVHTVLKFTPKEKNYEYVSVMTVMNNLANKGFVKRTKYGRRYLYTPAYPETYFIRSVLNNLFGDSLLKNPGPLVNYLISAKSMPQHECEKLQEFLDALNADEERNE